MEVTRLESEVTELALFEQDKENLRPKRSGRSARALQEVYSTDSKDMDDQKQNVRQEFEARLAELSEDAERLPGSDNEVVDLWLEYANWASEYYPHTPAEERSVLERATNFLAEKPEFYSSPGHLKLWLRLASMERDPQEIFYFLFTNNIGKKDPALYEEWASALEKRKEHKKAHDLLFDGMFQCRNDQTAYQRLYLMRQALMARMMDLGEWSYNGRGPRMLSMEQPEPTSRPILNPITSDEAKELHRPLECRPVEARRLSEQPVLMRVRGPPGFASIVREDVEDDVPEPRESLFNPTALPRRAPEVESVRQKENKQKPEAAFALPSRAAPSGRRTKKSAGRSSNAPNAAPCALASPLPVYVDEEFQDEKVFEESRLAEGTRKGKGSAVPPDSPAPPKPAVRTPDAPQKESRRKRRAAQAAAEETASSSLAASLSQLQIHEEPPAKRACRILEKPPSKPATPQTPPRRRDPFAPRRSDRNGKSPGIARSWSPPRTTPQHGRRGSNTFSSKSPKDTASSKRSTKSDVDQEGLAGLQALQGMFGTRRGYGRSCSRLLVFED